MIKVENIVRHELIGLKVKIADSTDSKKVGLSGKVVDETQKTLLVRTARGEKQIAKAECTFQFTLPNKKIVQVDGKLLVGRPEERIKKRFPGKW